MNSICRLWHVVVVLGALRCCLPKPDTADILQTRYIGGVSLMQTYRTAQVSGARTAAKSEASAEAVPEWKLDLAYNPSYKFNQFQAGTAAKGRAEGVLQPVGSTPGQDRQRCPLIKLPEDATIGATGTSWSQLWGFWQGLGGLQLATWQRNYLNQVADSTYINDMDGRLALKVIVMKSEDLYRIYNWKKFGAASPSTRYSEAGLSMADGNYDKKYDPQPANGEKKALEDEYVVLLDCDSSLLFVFRFEGMGPLGLTEIYDRSGVMMAHTLDDPMIARQQFVDPNGYLLATAESPALFANMSRKLLTHDASRGNILPYEIHFETGGYTNSSRLIDDEYRYVIGAATSARALYEAAAIRDVGNKWLWGARGILGGLGLSIREQPNSAVFVGCLFWGLILLALLISFCCFRGLYHMVYLDGALAKGDGTAFVRSEKNWVFYGASNKLTST